jgi:hypothetical protein
MLLSALSAKRETFTCESKKSVAGTAPDLSPGADFGGVVAMLVLASG